MYIHAYKHAKLNVHFSKNSSDFVVREQPLYEFSGNGEHLIVHIQKKDLSTNELIKDLSSYIGIKSKDIGYAGLKDKQGLTSQYISIPKKYEAELKNFNHDKCKILNLYLHNNKIKLGHLKGNSFFIRLKKVNKIDALKIEQIFNKIAQEGFPNYFGYQRFGKNQDNAKTGLDILNNEINFKNKKLNNFLISALQSEIFNSYLSKRIEISHFSNEFSKQELSKIYNNETVATNLKKQKQFFKLFDNEIFEHFPYGKIFNESLDNAIERFNNKDISPSGLILGNNPRFNDGLLGEIENEIYGTYKDLLKSQSGSRRYLWTFLENPKLNYIEEQAQLTLDFTLQKGSYATVVLDEIIKLDHNELSLNTI